MADAVLHLSCWEAMDLSQLPSDIGKTLDRSWGFSCFLCQMKQEAGKGKAGDFRKSSAVVGPALGICCGQVLGRGWMEQRWCLVSLQDWTMLGKEDNTATMALLILQQKLDAWKN